MEQFIYNLIVSSALIFTGLFLEKIIHSLFHKKRIKEYGIFIKFYKTLLLVVGTIILALSAVEFIHPESGDVVDMIKAIFLTVSGIVAFAYLFFRIRDRKTAIYATIVGILFLFMAGYGIIKFFSYNKENQYILENHAVIIEGKYGLTIPFNNILDVSASNEMPDILIRTNGVSYRKVRKGFFRLKNGTDCFMSIHNVESYPIIEIIRKNDIPVFINCETEKETRLLYEKIENVKIDF